MDNKILSFGRSAGELHTWGELHTRDKKKPPILRRGAGDKLKRLYMDNAAFRLQR